MLRRTKGRILLSLLVITGLAGTISSSISKSERKLAISKYKETRAEVASTIKSLSETQLNFRPAADQWSVKDCIYHIIMTEKTLWQRFTENMKTPASPEQRAKVTIKDDELLKAVVDRSQKYKASEELQPVKASWASANDAVDEFKKMRVDQIKYIRSTTEDLRNHVFDFPFGSVDGYQFLLFISGHSSRHLGQIKEIQNHPDFPTK